MSAYRDAKQRREVRELRARVRALEAKLEPPRFKGSPLTLESIRSQYEVLRTHTRFAVLRVHPELAEEAMAVTSEIGPGDMRGLRSIVPSEHVPECGWELVPA